MSAYFILSDTASSRALSRERVFRDRTQPLEVYSDKELIARYRFPRATICSLIDILTDSIASTTQRSHSISPTTKVLVALRFYAVGTTLTSVGDLHGISKTSTSRTIHEVSHALKMMVTDFIKFPSSDEELASIKKKFYEMGQFPNVIGCIDGSHIPIIEPLDEEYNFVNRKGYHSINCQAICDADLKLLNFVVRYPGSTHDAFIWNQCFLYDRFKAGEYEGWLLGDSGYPLKPYLLTPILDPATRPEQKYNKAFCRVRNTIERCFGVIKAR